MPESKYDFFLTGFDGQRMDSFYYLENKFSGYGLSVVHFQLPGFA